MDELNQDQRKELFNLLESFLSSAGWSWFRGQMETRYDDSVKTIMHAKLENIERARGMALAYRTLLDMPKNTLATLEQDLGLVPPEPGPTSIPD